MTHEQREFLLAVEDAERADMIWQAYKERVPEASHDDYCTQWARAKRMGYIAEVPRTVAVLSKGRKALARSAVPSSDAPND